MEGILTEMRTKVAAKVEMKGEQKAFKAGIGGEEKKECNTWGIFTILNLDSMGTVQWEQRSVGLWGTQQRELLDRSSPWSFREKNTHRFTMFSRLDIQTGNAICRCEFQNIL